MSYLSDTGEISARFRPAETVENLAFGSGTIARLVAPGSATNGQFGLFEWNMPAGKGGAEPHFHKTISESFFITEGRVRLFDGAKTPSSALRCAFFRCRVRLQPSKATATTINMTIPKAPQPATTLLAGGA